MKDKKKFKVIRITDQNKLAPKVQAEVRPHTDIAVCGSPETSAPPGYKCDHGIYIPASAESPDHAPYCSLCYPYLVEV